MIKLIGCILLILSCSLMGCIKANTYKERRCELENILESIKLIEMYITYRREPLQKVFIKTANARMCWFSNVLNECAKNMDSQHDIEKAWRKAIERHMETTTLSEDDIVIIEDMVLGLGKSDLLGQRRMLDPIISRISDQHKEAVYREKSLGKLYRTLGAASGVVIAIIII